MACRLLEQDEVPPSPRRAFDGVIDEGDCRWRFKSGLLVIFIRYFPAKKKVPAHELPWAEFWSREDARR